MEFFVSVFFLLFYYLRPQDWVPGLAGANMIKPIIGVWLIILIASRSRPSPLSGLLKTPHDWIIVAYLGYIIATAPDATNAFKGVIPLFAFYALTVQSVNSWPRLLAYLKWWNIALIAIACIAVASLYGMDLTGAREVTARFSDRLAIGTWLHDNPNALAHSVVAVIPLSYILLFWKSSVTNRLFLFPVISAIVTYCLWETESKGAYITGGVAVASVFVIGRPKFVQILVLVAAMTLGVSALSFLPRMSQMSDLSSNEGVQGRLMAWEIARTVAEQYPTGEGWKQFIAVFPMDYEGRLITVRKSTHSSYVQIGADLGKYGIFLYLAGLWTAIHTLLALKTQSDLQERCRRAIFVLILANAVSGWMINRQYHTEYFLLIAAAGAIHRLQKGEELASRQSTGSDHESAPDGSLENDRPTVGDPTIPNYETPAYSNLIPATIGVSPLKPLWNRFGLVDFGICFALTWLTIWTWDYLLLNV